RGHNVTTVMIGVGSNWDYKNVIDLSGKFGPGGWAHIPMAPGQDVIALLLNEVLVDLRSADRYLSVFSEQPNNKLYGLSPSIREGDEGRFFAGYQRSLEAVCFSPHLDPMLKLSCGLHVGDLRPEILEIPVIDVHDPKAGIYFEQTERARQLLGPILVQIAMLEGNYELLGSLKDQHPELAEKIQVLIENMRDFANADASMATRASVSSVGNTVIMTRRNVNALSRVDIPKRRGDPSELPPQAGFGQVEGEGESAQAPNLYSGMVGPLDVAPGTDLPPLDPQDLDPRAYDHVVPVGAAKLSYVTADGYQELDLGALFSTRSSILIGRGRSADIVFGEPSVSTIHAEIGRDEHGFYLLDRNSTNGTFVNNTRISGPCYLKNGDEIRIGSTSIEFHA
ncbi:MAG: FHA domain-containing protein, partial [Bdellovibrionales bacterium]|nr:FHA domain-containing protein [Bdellovibrionales bacterium]